MTLVAIFIATLAAKMIDPLIIVLAVIAGAVSRAWWHVAAGSFVAAVALEALVLAIGPNLKFVPFYFIVGIAAVGLWASLAFWLIRRCRRSRPKESQGSN